ncbi:MAG: type VI secretion system lipoprotein TssJ [Desulfobacula sp.]|jgi:type VI secretion system VasD/TssJ family lipoprotein|uniref:type VI secretion system lipoprotein TssJ n=1 Tax=Desulfobacula sp. TaxID=2593537 RepID=UPI001E1AB216|nr:type VI secretion system lipoprotein TssJ [Desulfobacula sp.]MBT3485419.1 type VI secretion system lipoprotein TssJ [Desulfobacula sp.]MBT3805562.1 type VI secretion system lipoprotein TssJ [Desulfobacula sp.]MBT4026058.1 type VI secretion system lipoprotein TssJ [Desulfobacula sp.]MBT4199994.1 type VI secretion system lipoprotein TssJ [Desulfobacula sp.]
MSLINEMASSLLKGLLIIIFLLIASCGGKEPRPEPEWVYKPQSVEISYTADVMLNEFKGSSHALQLVIYQVDNVNKFVELSEYKDGLKKLLKAQNFDPSVQAVKKIFVDPGESNKLVFDRAEKSQWVGIVAGYFDLAPGRATCFFEIPHKIEKKGMVFFKKEVAVISDFKLNLMLKEHEIKGIILDE